jgi:hypothetical protein
MKAKFTHHNCIFIFLIFIFLFFSSFIFAQEKFQEKISSKEIEKLVLQSKAIDLYIRFIKLHPDDENFKSLDSKILKTELETFIENYIEAQAVELQNVLDQQERQELRTATHKAVQTFNWENFLNKIKSLPKTIKTFTRLHGIGNLAAFSAGITCRIIVPRILIYSGHAYLIPILAFTPYNVVTQSLYLTMKNINTRTRMIKLLGSKSAYKEFLEQQKNLRKAFGGVTKDDILIPISFYDNSMHAVAISKNSIKNTILSKLGLKKNTLTYEKLHQYFLKEEILEKSYLETLLLNNLLPSEIKASLLLSEFAALGTEEQKAKFFLEFSNFLHEIKLDENTLAVKNWVSKFANMKSIEDAIQIIKEAPKNVNSQIIASIWKNIGLPILAEKDINISLMSFRKLIRAFEDLELEAYKTKTLWDDEWILRYERSFQIYIKIVCTESLKT